MITSRPIDPGVMFAILLSVLWIAATALLKIAASDRDKPIAVAP